MESARLLLLVAAFLVTPRTFFFILILFSYFLRDGVSRLVKVSAPASAQPEPSLILMFIFVFCSEVESTLWLCKISGAGVACREFIFLFLHSGPEYGTGTRARCMLRANFALHRQRPAPGVYFIPVLFRSAPRRARIKLVGRPQRRHLWRELEEPKYSAARELSSTLKDIASFGRGKFRTIGATSNIH